MQGAARLRSERTACVSEATQPATPQGGRSAAGRFRRSTCKAPARLLSERTRGVSEATQPASPQSGRIKRG